MDTLTAIERRHSCRKFLQTKQIDAEVLEAIIKAAYAAPVGMNQKEKVHLSVIQNKELLNEIDKNAAVFMGDTSKHPLYGAPTLVIVSTLMENPPKDMLGWCNASCIVENMLLAATEKGLGSVYILGAIAGLKTNAELVNNLNLPEGFMPTASVAIGYPAEPLKHMPHDPVTTQYI